MKIRILLSVSCFILAQAGPGVAGESTTGGYDADAAIATSQAAVGRQLQDLPFRDSRGQQVHLSQYRGRPLLISMIFTSCHHVCPALTRHLATAVASAREALGEDSFQVLTVGFDTAVDTPEAMRFFAHKQGVDAPDWAFLSGSADAVAELVENIGYVYYPSPRGFDHINQVTVLDRDGVVYRQVYGAAFDLPLLVEPLKELVYNRPRPGEHFAFGLLNRIRLFCTVYDPNSGHYRFDYSLFVGMAVGALMLLFITTWLIIEFRRKRKSSQGD